VPVSPPTSVFFHFPAPCVGPVPLGIPPSNLFFTVSRYFPFSAVPQPLQCPFLPDCFLSLLDSFVSLECPIRSVPVFVLALYFPVFFSNFKLASPSFFVSFGVCPLFIIRGIFCAVPPFTPLTINQSPFSFFSPFFVRQRVGCTWRDGVGTRILFESLPREDPLVFPFFSFSPVSCHIAPPGFVSPLDFLILTFTVSVFRTSNL